MSNIVWYVPLDGPGELPLDLDACLRRIPILDVMHHGNVVSPKSYQAFYLTPKGRWVGHFVEYPDAGDDEDRPRVWFHEITPARVASLSGCSPEFLRASVSDPEEQTSGSLEGRYVRGPG